jgi:hypothetical protein
MRTVCCAVCGRERGTEGFSPLKKGSKYMGDIAMTHNPPKKILTFTGQSSSKNVTTPCPLPYGWTPPLSSMLWILIIYTGGQMHK